ncbi:MAG: type I restriction-modification enzyme R subunit C-terminal domain-containing protein [Pseudomonadota bacterium]
MTQVYPNRPKYCGYERRHQPGKFEHVPLAQEGGLGKVYQLFGDELNSLIEQLNESLAA